MRERDDNHPADQRGFSSTDTLGAVDEHPNPEHGQREGKHQNRRHEKGQIGGIKANRQCRLEFRELNSWCARRELNPL
jgi:hypothetical protein